MSLYGRSNHSRMDIIPATDNKGHMFPANWVARVLGFHQDSWILSRKFNEKQQMKFWLCTVLLLLRGIALFLYLSACMVWVIMFSICVFSYELILFEQGKAKGTEKDTNIVIRLLDNVPWTAIMVRNIVVTVIFYYRYPRMVNLTKLLSRLLLTFDPSSETLSTVMRWTRKMAYISSLIVVVNFVLLLMYYFSANFAYISNVWRFQPIPLTLVGWQVVCCMAVFSLPNYLVSQIILGSAIGLAAGGLQLVKLLNKSLEELRQRQDTDAGHYWHHNARELAIDLSVSTGPPAKGQQERQDQDDEKMAELRRKHFRIVQYIHAVTDVFSEILLVSVAADFAAAVGYMGLLIGRVAPTNILSLYFGRTYHAACTLTWMGFYLCGQFWPLILLPEEANKTFHYIQGVSFCSGKSKLGKWERELQHFMLATRDTYVGVVAGKLLYFSRQLSVTIITLLCSYGVLVYELLHRGTAAETHGTADATVLHSLGNHLNVSDVALELGSLIGRKLIDSIAFHQNVTGERLA